MKKTTIVESLIFLQKKGLNKTGIPDPFFFGSVVPAHMRYIFVV